MQTNRAKKLNQDGYAEGLLLPPCGANCSISDGWVFHDRGMFVVSEEDIDKTTLSIHLHGMTATSSNRYLPNGEEDLRIFASLSEGHKGGDIILGRYSGVVSGTVYYDSTQQAFMVAVDASCTLGFDPYLHEIVDIEIMGVQE